MELAKIEWNDFGGAPICEHNMPCAVCWTKPAVYLMNDSHFEPCWKCQEKGWKLIQVKKKRSWKFWVSK